MYIDNITTEKFEEICRELECPEGAIDCLLPKYGRISESANGSRELQNALDTIMVCRGDFGKVRPHLDAILEETGINRFELEMIFRIFSVPKLYEIYRRHGVPDNIIADTLKDIPEELGEYHQLHGGWGGWFLWFYVRNYEVKLFRLGRLEFETFSDSDDVGIHIPAEGRLEMKDVIASLKQAYEFFGYKCSGRQMKVICDSWILFPAMKDLLAEGSNLKKFFDLFTITGSEETDGNLWFLFMKPQGTPVKELPEDTSLRKRCKDYLMSGHMLGSGEGYFYFDGENIE